MCKNINREKLGYMFAVLSRPIDSFYEIRYRDKGSIPLAVICVFTLSALFTINRVFSGFVVNNVNPRDINGISDMIAFFIIPGLFCIGNWSVTCLMEGEGRMKDIVTVAGYAMLPIVLLLGPATLISNFISLEEASFYYIIIGAGITWTAILLLVGIMTVHNYTLAKTIVTLLFTIVSMLIIIFVTLLLLDILNQIYGFLYSIYIEIVLRF